MRTEMDQTAYRPAPGYPVSTHEMLMGLLHTSGAKYRLMHHPAEGRTESASRLRRHHPSQAAKCIVIRVSLGKRARQYVLAVVPGDLRVDLDAVCRAAGGTKALFAQRDKAEQLAGSISGSIIPFAFHPDLELIADPRLLSQNELFFNAARLDQSVALLTGDYISLAAPRVERIAT